MEIQHLPLVEAVVGISNLRNSLTSQLMLQLVEEASMREQTSAYASIP